MTSAHVLPNIHRNIVPSVHLDVRDVTIKAIYFSLVATAFVFVSILLTGIHP